MIFLQTTSLLSKKCGNSKCPSRGKFLPLESFHKNKSKKDGRDGVCKKCVSIRKKSHYKQVKKGKSHSSRFNILTVGDLGDDLVEELALCFADISKRVIYEEESIQ